MCAVFPRTRWKASPRCRLWPRRLRQRPSRKRRQALRPQENDGIWCGASDQKWNIGSVVLPGRMLLAPTAGITDQAMRLICAQMGCHFSYTEMVSAKGYLMSAKERRGFCRCHPEEHAACSANFWQRSANHGGGGRTYPRQRRQAHRNAGYQHGLPSCKNRKKRGWERADAKSSAGGAYH